jgi:2-dehydro-3-deoxyphosphogluconate aldolase/(4S)-4-hydroxy-2-oxoglutarate aldolase
MDDIERRIGEIGIVPVVRLEDAGQAVELGKALAAGGIPVAEITFRTKAALPAIESLARDLPSLLIGAGTVTDAGQAADALSAGARFIVSPAWVDEVVDFCLERGVPVLPGVSGPDGMAKGVARGLRLLKFFPAEALGGLAMLEALSGPFPGMRFVPTGGIDAGNIGAYARRPFVHAVGGSWMVKSDAIAAHDWNGIARACRQAVFALHGFSFAYMGLAADDESAAAKTAELLASLFGFSGRQTDGAIFASDAIEVSARPRAEGKGRIAIRCNDVDRAVARFRGLGLGTRPGSSTLRGGRTMTAALDLEIAGFAVLLVSA